MLFGTLVVFCGGFYAGVYAAKRVTASDSGILHRIFGIQPPAPVVVTPKLAPAPPAAAASTAPVQAATPPVAPQKVVPVTTAPDTGAAAAPGAESTQAASTSSDNTSSSSSSQASGDSGEDRSQLAKQVEDYNDMLHRIQDALQHYSVIHKKSVDSKVKAADLKQLVDQENRLCTEVSEAAKHAENLQDAIRANTNYASLYMEGSYCVARKDVPTSLLDLDLDKLKFIDKSP